MVSVALGADQHRSAKAIRIEDAGARGDRAGRCRLGDDGTAAELDPHLTRGQPTLDPVTNCAGRPSPPPAVGFLRARG